MGRCLRTGRCRRREGGSRQCSWPTRLLACTSTSRISAGGWPRPAIAPDLFARYGDVSKMGLYGGKDQGIPNDQVEKMRAALKEAGNPSQIVIYPNADHAFLADYRPSYDKAAAEDGWKRMLAW